MNRRGNKSKNVEIGETKKKEQEVRLVDNVKNLYRIAYDNKAPYHEVWEKCFKAYTGELYKQNLPSYRSQEVSNFTFSTIETIKPIMLSENPEFVALPARPEHLEKAETIRDVLKYEWDRTKMFTILQKVLTSMLIYGTGIVGLFWNGNKDGIGQIEPVLISPFNFFPDPMAETLNDGQFAIYATYKPIGEVIKFAPEKEEEIRENASMPDDKYLMFGKETSNVSTDQNILYIEAYVKDYTVELEEYEENGKLYQTSKMKYPNGRRIIIAGDVLLRDGENSYNDGGKFPFVAIKCYDVIGKQWGMGEVEQIISPTVYASKVMNHILETTRLMSNPVWILDKNSGVTKNSLTNRDGLVIRKNPGTEVKRDAPPSIPAYVVTLPDLLLNHVEHISGVYDVTRGERPTGITAAAAIQALNEQSQGRIKLKVQSMEVMLSELGSMWLRRMKQFWEIGRLIRIQPDGEESPQFEEIDKDFVDGDWEIVVKTGSTMQSNKTAIGQQLISMAQTMAEDGLPMIDRQTLLENSDIPGVARIIKRFEALRQEQRELQMQQQQQMQMQMEEQQQQKIQEFEMKRQQDIENMQMKHNFDIEKKLVDNDLKKEQEMLGMEEQIPQDFSDTRDLGLQSQEMDLLSNQEPSEDAQVVMTLMEQLLPELQKMSEKELEELIKEVPEIALFLELLLKAQNEQPSEEGLIGGM